MAVAAVALEHEAGLVAEHGAGVFRGRGLQGVLATEERAEDEGEEEAHTGPWPERRLSFKQPLLYRDAELDLGRTQAVSLDLPTH